LGGKSTGKNPTDRGKLGVKRSLLADGRGVPLGVVVEGANRHDSPLLEATLESIPVKRPDPKEVPQHLCLDAAYVGEPIQEIVAAWGYTAHIRSRGEEHQEKQTIPGYRARRWVVERTHSWMNRYRRLLIRWEKKEAHYLAFLHLALACITFQTAGLFG
jgi:transposase